LAALIAVMLAALPFAVMATPNGPDRPATLELLAFGDSLVHGYGLPEGDTFPARLEAALRARGHAVNVVNAGNSGDTTEAGRARLDWVMRDSVDAAIVVLGANDALRGIDPAVTRRNLDAILGKLKEKGVPALLAGMKAPRNMGADYVDSFDGLYPSLARNHDVVYYPFFLKGVATDRDLNQADGIHPNAEGVAVIVENILPKVEELIQKARNSRETQG
jgi:acyl-CoA thioesterase-1